ncbi:N-acetyltransferase [Ligilactobacillus salivarius]|uniref:N-acetyltransferase n=1 Tax=Ligilactobacillus salivarius TaxID=1624 RepID=UPI00137037F3|nr:N-acetyltransferase [Ligilactobacillus salivarius]MYU93535.1 N-acetyltransferase [Ligilactobacillus salivarius]MYY53396.1 N-acetyltransferase [Ligilactobacillus salivarius]
MIREFQISDTQIVMQLWLAGNEDAHSFIAKEYWKANFEEVEKQLLKADIFVYDLNGEIKGFIGLMDEYIAGIFVDKAYRSQGIGRQLLEYVKQLHSTLSLNVYQKNEHALRFYRENGFTIVSKQNDEHTGEIEFTMIWNKNKVE